jgi:hypothetical protein
MSRILEKLIYSLHSFKYNQQDATLYNVLYYCQYSTCFGRFLRPSSGAQELYTQRLVRARLAVATAMYLLSITTNKMQRYTIFFIIVTALHVSGGFSAHHQDLRNCIHSTWYVQACLLLPLCWQLRVRIPPGVRMFVSCECCQVEVSATG